MTTLEILRGVPASGKSTHAAARKEEGWAVASRDAIRFATFGDYWGPHVDEDVVTAIENATISASLHAGRNTVVDATNMSRKNVRTKQSLASRYGASVVFLDFPIDAELAIARDAARHRTVGGKVIQSFIRRYRIDPRGGPLPKPNDLWPTFEPYVRPRDRGLPLAYIVDTDGTLANLVHRGPYDHHMYDTDEVFEEVATVVRALQNHGVIIIALSGRDEEYRRVTEKWWWDVAGIQPEKFFMRPEGDKRVDAIVKYEIFKTHVEPFYDVLGAFDDRPQVIRMWQSIGVPTFSVGPGREF